LTVIDDMTLLGYVERNYLVKLVETEGNVSVMSLKRSKARWFVEFLADSASSNNGYCQLKDIEKGAVERAEATEKIITLDYKVLSIQLQTTMALDDVHMLFITLHLVRAFVTVKGELKGIISRGRLRHALRIS
jgi:hypothetical protein